jgi:hypothetical protein
LWLNIIHLTTKDHEVKAKVTQREINHCLFRHSLDFEEYMGLKNCFIN